MKAALSRAMLALTCLCLGRRYRAWGLAMRAEFEQAVEAGRPLRFAIGCLVAAWCRMPWHEEGRFSLTAHALALGLILPMATLQIGSTLVGVPDFLHIGRFAVKGSLQGYLLASTYQVLVPLLSALSLLIGAAQVRMAWLLLERDWARAGRAGAFTLAAATTIVLLLALLGFNVVRALRETAILLIELGMLMVLVQWHAEVPQLALNDDAAA